MKADAVPAERRALVLTSVAAVSLWAALVLVFGGLHFDDFVNLAESRGALSLEGWPGLAFDGRWQPLKRATYALLLQLAGLTFWPHILAVMVAHVAVAAGVASCARAIWRAHGPVRVSAAVALASLNLSAYSLSYAATLHGVASVALTVWCVALALHAALEPKWRARRWAPAVLAGAAACLYKETAVMTPVLALFAGWLAGRDRRLPVAQVVRVAAPAIAGVFVYLVLRVMADVPLIPPRGRYSGGGLVPVALNALGVLVHVLPWAGAALVGSIGIRAWRPPATDLIVVAAAALGAILPTLVLSWQSPNFFYAALPVAALAAAHFTVRAHRPARAELALAVLVIAVLAASVASAALRGAHRWGPYSEASIEQWLTLPREGGRIVWFDADSRASYGGLVRTIGPGERLTHALRLASGDERVIADVCISVLVSSPYVWQPGDELYLHSAGQLQRIASPPLGKWYCNLP